MHKRFCVRRLQCLCYLSSDSQRVRPRQGPGAQASVQRLAPDVLHDDKERPLVLTNFEDLADKGMVKRGCRQGFAAKALAGHGVGGEMCWQELDGDTPIQTRIVSQVDLAHSAAGEALEDLVRTDLGARAQSH